MPITITGSKYSSATLSSVGTTTITVSTTPFVLADFTSQRLVGLWNSAGTTFKAMAWVRRHVSTSQLELQTEFFDPATGLTVAQVVGDIVLVSKNFTESVVTGLAVSGSTITITDGTSLTFGTAGTSNSVCFYDEGKNITTNCATLFAGGLSVFGKLDDYATNKVSSPCNWYLIGVSANSSFGIRTVDTISNMIFYGGNIDGNRDNIYYIGSNIGFTGGGVSGNTVIFNGVQCCFGFASPSAGSNWGSTASRCQLINCFFQSTAINTILVRWANGIIKGGLYKFPNNTSSPISVFGSDTFGTITITTPANQRAIVLDMGNGPALVRTNGAVLNFNFTNLITTDFRGVTGASGSLTPNSNCTNTFRFSDSYTNLQSGSVAIFLDNTGTLVASQSSTTTTYEPSLLRRTCVGATVTVNATSWNYGFKKYGFDTISGSITPSTYSLGTAGNADNVVFGGLVNQLVDTNITLSQTNANLLTTIASTNNFYDALINWNVLNTTNAQYPTIAIYPANIVGTTIDLSTKNLIIDTISASVIAVNTSTNTITIKSSTLDKTTKFTTLQASTITINANTIVNVDLTASIVNNGTISGFIYGNITNTGTLASGIEVVGNLSQTTPTNITGANIMGNINYNTNSNITITYTNSTITGTVSNAGSGIITIQLINSTIGTVGLNVVGQYPITISDSNNNAISVRVFVYNNTSTLVSDSGYQSLVSNYTVYMPIGGSIRVYSIAYGYIAKITNTNSTSANLIITHIPETLVDTSLNTTTRNLIASYFNAVIESNVVYVELSQDLAQYTPDVVLNAMHYFIVSNGANLAYQALSLNSVNAITLVNGGFRVNIANFKGRPTASLNSTNTPKLYITIPLIFEDNTGISGNQILVRNTNGIAINPALWTKAQANITAGDVSNITNNVWTYTDRTLNGALFK